MSLLPVFKADLSSLFLVCVSCLPLALPMLVAGKGDSSGFRPVSTFLTLLRHRSVVVLRVGLSSCPVPGSPTGKTSRGRFSEREGGLRARCWGGTSSVQLGSAQPGNGESLRLLSRGGITGVGARRVGSSTEGPREGRAEGRGARRGGRGGRGTAPTSSGRARRGRRREAARRAAERAER